MVEWIGQIQAGAMYPVSDDDKKKLSSLNTGALIKNNSSGSKKTRVYKQLCAYKSACKYVSNNVDRETWQHKNADFENWNTPEKVDLACKLALGFYDKKNFVVTSTLCSCGATHEKVTFIFKSLSYSTCNHIEACEYISDAFELMERVLCMEPETLIKALNSL